MKAEYLNPFTEAAYYVLSEVLSPEGLKREELDARDDPVVTHGVATIVGITGDLTGHVIYDMSRKTAVAAASVMNGEELAGLDNLVRSTINELANMITGQAAARLSEAGYSCDITPPTFVVGDKSEVYSIKAGKHLIVPFKTRSGEIFLSLSLARRGA